MKIIKAYKNSYGHLYIMVDSIPKITYEKVGLSYVGSDTEGYFSHYLEYERGYGRFLAFAGRTISIELKDGAIENIKNHWWDKGNYDTENEYISIGLATLEHLQDCFVFCSYNIRKDKLEAAIEEYLKNNDFVDYWEIEKWCNLQYNWYPLVYHGRKLPFLMNYRGDIIDVATRKHKYVQYNYIKRKKQKTFKLRLFKLQYKENGRLIKLEDSYDNIAKETLSDEEFQKYQLYVKNKN